MILVLAIVAVLILALVLGMLVHHHREELPVLTEHDAAKGMRPLTSAVSRTYESPNKDR